MLVHSQWLNCSLEKCVRNASFSMLQVAIWKPFVPRERVKITLLSL